MNATSEQPQQTLRREIGLFGAVMLGLGSIIGSGVFVSIALAAAAAGPSVILAIVVAALVARCNGLSSAQLAARHPLSGGTYEYGYRWLNPVLGFTAGWMFLCAKSASAATAALGCSGYLLHLFGAEQSRWHVPLALVVVSVLVLLVLGGIRRSSRSNIAIVSVTLLSLVVFVLGGLPTAISAGTRHLTPFFAPVEAGRSPAAGFLEASALLFVAYTGYGRIATLAEEVRTPRRTIPLAVFVTLLVTMGLYASVGLVGISAAGPKAFAVRMVGSAAPLEVVAQRFGVPGVPEFVAVGAVTAMAGVLLNLILGLSRVVLAMARRRDLPALFARVGGAAETPFAAILLVGVLTGGLVFIGNVKTTWSFSAFTVLIYYALTNLAAIRMSEEERLYPRVIPWLGLFACLFLAFWVERTIWMTGLGLIAAGLAWRWLAVRLRRPATTS